MQHRVCTSARHTPQGFLTFTPPRCRMYAFARCSHSRLVIIVHQSRTLQMVHA